MSFAITENNGVLHIRLSGHLDNDELLKLDKELFEKWDPQQLKGHIYDYLDTTTVSFSDDEIRSIAVLDTNESFITGHLRIGIVTIDPDVLHFSKVYQEHMKNSDWQVEIFSTVEEALAFCSDSDLD